MYTCGGVHKMYIHVCIFFPLNVVCVYLVYMYHMYDRLYLAYYKYSRREDTFSKRMTCMLKFLNIVLILTYT